MAIDLIGLERSLGPDEVLGKRCTKCGTPKALVDFYDMKTSRDGKSSHCKDCAGKLGNEGTQKMRLKVIDALGGSCVWPGCMVTDPVLLVVDHVDGGGGEHRKKSNPYGYYKGMLDDLESYQVLCWNHNHLKRIRDGEHRKSEARRTDLAGKTVVLFEDLVPRSFQWSDERKESFTASQAEKYAPGSKAALERGRKGGETKRRQHASA